MRSWCSGTETRISRKKGFFGVLEFCFEASDHVRGSLRGRFSEPAGIMLYYLCGEKKKKRKKNPT